MRVVVTRALHQAEELAAPLRDLGAEVILLPMIGIAPPANDQPLRRAAGNANAYDWVIFTSSNAVTSFAQYVSRPGSLRARIATIGTATRDTAQEFGFAVSVVPPRYVAESLVEALGGEDLGGKRVLIPAAAVTRDVIPLELRKRGAQVDVVEAYRNVMPPDSESRAREIFRPPFPDWLIFASPSAVDHLLRVLDREVLSEVKIASIGPVTSAAVIAHGLDVTVEATPHTVAGLIESLKPYSPSGTNTQ